MTIFFIWFSPYGMCNIFTLHSNEWFLIFISIFYVLFFYSLFFLIFFCFLIFLFLLYFFTKLSFPITLFY
ncbi:hypothetical protein FMT86_11960 [Clostridium perfringens]|nr:hypothetical protein [Clostridium perfringens]